MLNMVKAHATYINLAPFREDIYFKNIISTGWTVNHGKNLCSLFNTKPKELWCLIFSTIEVNTEPNYLRRNWKISLFNCITVNVNDDFRTLRMMHANREPNLLYNMCCCEKCLRVAYGCAIASTAALVQHQNNTSAYTWRWHRQFNAFHCTYETTLE